MLFPTPSTTGNDLDSIRALFSEKEKELSLAVAKVEALTRQLEDVRRDRRAPLALIPGNGNGNGSSTNGGGGSGAGGNVAKTATSPAALELDKLRRELMVSVWTRNNLLHKYCTFTVQFAQLSTSVCNWRTNVFGRAFVLAADCRHDAIVFIYEFDRFSCAARTG